MNEELKATLQHVKTMFGWHGGMGDPPSDDAIVAIIRGALEFGGGDKDNVNRGPRQPEPTPPDELQEAS